MNEIRYILNKDLPGCPSGSLFRKSNAKDCWLNSDRKENEILYEFTTEEMHKSKDWFTMIGGQFINPEVKTKLDCSDKWFNKSKIEYVSSYKNGLFENRLYKTRLNNYIVSWINPFANPPVKYFIPNPEFLKNFTIPDKLISENEY